MANSLVNNVNVELYGRLRNSFINEWSNRHRVQFEEIEEKRTSRRYNSLKKKMHAYRMSYVRHRVGSQLRRREIKS